MSTFTAAMLVCSDLERSRAFYRDVLELPIRGSRGQSVDFDLGGGATLTLHEKTELLAVRPGSLQFAFLLDDVDAFVGRARAAGVPIFQDPDDEGPLRVAVIGDPDGYPVQVVSHSKKRR
ncbi:MAG: hypothetical protein NVS1B14_06760 [Vulcanimicrobiaceae bacterium]